MVFGPLRGKRGFGNWCQRWKPRLAGRAMLFRPLTVQISNILSVNPFFPSYDLPFG